VVLVFLGLGGLSHRLLARPAIRHLRSARQEHDNLMRHFHGLIEGIKELKLHAGRREAFLAQLLDASAAAVRDRFTPGQTLYTAANGWARLLFMASIGLVLFAVPAWTPVDPRTLTGYTLTLLFAVGPLDTLMAGLPLMTRARIALDKVEALGLKLEEGGR